MMYDAGWMDWDDESISDTFSTFEPDPQTNVENDPDLSLIDEPINSCFECGRETASDEGLCYECQTLYHGHGFDMDGQGWM